MPPPSPDPVSVLRSRRYVGLLVLAAILGVPISAAAYGFLALVAGLQEWLFSDLPKALGLGGAPWWWPLPLLTLAGVLVALTIRYLPGRGGHSPADGFKAGGVPSPIELPGIAIAALATLSLGAVLGPEAPLIALGAGLAGWAVQLARRDVPAQATAVVAAAGSFAAISALLGSPLLGAFLLMEISGLAGPTLGLVLVPGLVAAGVGSLIFVGLDNWTGLGTFSLALPDLPPFEQPDLAQFGWAIVIGLLAAVVGSGIRRLALALRPHVERRLLLVTSLVGMAVGGLAIVFAASSHSSSEVLFSGQDALGPFVSQSASYSVGALLLLVACKGLAYSASMASFRGGPVFPAMFLGRPVASRCRTFPGCRWSRGSPWVSGRCAW
jgi:H+/Cl- antiporter ClcA